ncbi:MAG: MFS transporter [Betaproteobacteria bacterium]|nr:MFS transporter [Betaproteobacteria bacterium]
MNSTAVSSTARNARFNVGLLAACQAMLMTNNATLIAVNGLAGLALAPTPSLATLPVTCWVVGGGIATMQASKYMKRVGRRAGLIRGASVGIVGALICAAAIWQASFWMLCFGALVLGTYNAFGQYYRFVAAEVSPLEFRATAVSLVLAGGLVGGIVGPTLSRFTVDLVGPKFAGAYLALIVFSLVTMAVLSRIRIPNPSAAEQAASGRPLSEIAAQPKYIVAVMAGAISYGVMNFLMTSTPIAMGVCGHPYGDAAFVISSHVVAMFAPSFVTGGLIKRFGTIQVMLAGAALNVVCIAIALSGVAVANFWWALVLLGVGWNFLYIGATTLLTETYRPEERAKAQGANETAIFAMMAISSFSSGMIVTNAGWEKVNYAATPLIAVVILALLFLFVELKKNKT